VIITKLQVASVELVVSSESSCALRLARPSQNAWARHVERVESRRVESSQVEFGLYRLWSTVNWRFLLMSRHWADHVTISSANFARSSGRCQ